MALEFSGMLKLLVDMYDLKIDESIFNIAYEPSKFEHPGFLVSALCTLRTIHRYNLTEHVMFIFPQTFHVYDDPYTPYVFVVLRGKCTFSCINSTTFIVNTIGNIEESFYDMVKDIQDYDPKLVKEMKAMKLYHTMPRN